MLNRLPKYPPSLGDMLADIGNPGDKAVAKAFGVTTRTVRNWHRRGAPRPVLLSLFWLTRWGCSELDSDWHWRLTNAEALVECLQADIKKARSQRASAEIFSLPRSKRKAA